MRKWIIALVVLAVVIGGSIFAYQATAKEKEPPPPDYEIYTVTKGDIYATVSSTGVIEPAQEVKLSFKGTGKVADILVDIGDPVKKGQILARLEDDELQLQLKQAQANLKMAEANLAKAKTPPDDSDIAAARAQLESARAQADAARAAYQAMLAGPTPAQRKVAEAQLKRAEAALKHAQEAYNEIADQPNAGMLPQAIQLQQATIDYEVAKANLEVTLAPPTESEKAQALAQIAAADAAVAQAESALARLLNGPSQADLAVLETQVEQAQIGVESAELALKNAQLISPIDGVVGVINIRANEFPNPALPAMIIADPEGFHIKLNVDELDIGQIEVGQTALITVDALNDAQLTGVVSRIAPVANTTPVGGGAITTYEVIINLDPTDQPLRSGMTATVAIITAQAENVIVIPNRVIRLDETTRQPYVEKIIDGVPTRVDIVLGLRNEQFSEVVSGLEEGDQLAVRRVDSGEILRSQFFGGGG
ncbi:MAG TPA: HlyD family efflux transporter periplasmic adaptor subunit [Anaerolineae bacterium]|nr:HlyD family efflux transporter periplasmic adaptor subunit [Anaerolineae bacterium]